MRVVVISMSSKASAESRPQWPGLKDKISMKERCRGYGLILEPPDLSLGRARAEAKGDTEGSSLSLPFLPK